MKKLFSFIFIVFILFLALFFAITSLFRKSTVPSTPSNILNTPLPTSPKKTSTVTWNDITYAYEYFEVNNISKLTLIANFTQKKTSERLMQENNCKYAVNGGFYDSNNRPLGLFANATVKTPSIENALVNGYISVTTKPTVSFDIQQNPVLAVQTGPMLMMDENKLKLAIKNDEYARRMIAGISSKGTLLFMTIFIPETKVQGPKLAELPDVIGQINKTLQNPLVSAINLDGGNASMFKNNTIYITEVSAVGSLFCVE